MKSLACLLAVSTLVVLVCLPATADGQSYLDGQIDMVISQIKSGNNAMHFLAREYLNEAMKVGGIAQWKIKELEDYINNVQPADPIVDRFPRSRR